MMMLTEGCSEKFLKKLIGRTDIEDALKRLDKLTLEESRMAAAENLKATHAVDERVRGVADTVAVIDNRVAGVDDRVAGVDKRVAGVDDQVQRTANDVEEMKRWSSLNLISIDYGTLPIHSGNQLRESIYKWLSPPDPSTNHNIACSTHLKKTASWFFQGSIFQEWKSTGSLLWIHGKRLPHRFSNLTPSNIISYCSWLW
jgi:archaellum component FlaC